MSRFKSRSRKIARDQFWEEHSRAEYECPDCGRAEDEVVGSLEVHHKNGEPMDNRPENHVALCRLCHNLREGKKPSTKQIRKLRSQAMEEKTPEQNGSGVPSVYLAGSMDHEDAEHQSWRASFAKRGDRGTYRYTGSTPVRVRSPTETSFHHGCGPVAGVAADDLKLIDQSDAILAYFEKQEQVGTLTELVYAVTKGMDALVVFDESLLSDRIPASSELGVLDFESDSPVYWFLINFLTTSAWGGLSADVEVRAVKSRDEIKEAFIGWEWHRRAGEHITESADL